jgi:hypothetical protein
VCSRTSPSAVYVTNSDSSNSSPRTCTGLPSRPSSHGSEGLSGRVSLTFMPLAAISEERRITGGKSRVNSIHPQPESAMLTEPGHGHTSAGRWHAPAIPACIEHERCDPQPSACAQHRRLTALQPRPSPRARHRTARRSLWRSGIRRSRRPCSAPPSIQPPWPPPRPNAMSQQRAFIAGAYSATPTRPSRVGRPSRPRSRRIARRRRGPEPVTPAWLAPVVSDLTSSPTDPTQAAGEAADPRNRRRRDLSREQQREHQQRGNQRGNHTSPTDCCGWPIGDDFGNIGWWMSR